MKKIRGKIHYFGSWAKRVNGELVRIEGDGCDDALKEYQAQAVALHAGRVPVAQKGSPFNVVASCQVLLSFGSSRQSLTQRGRQGCC
jgi:hypothetical protein